MDNNAAMDNLTFFGMMQELRKMANHAMKHKDDNPTGPSLVGMTPESVLMLLDGFSEVFSDALDERDIVIGWYHKALVDIVHVPVDISRVDDGAETMRRIADQALDRYNGRQAAGVN